MRSALVVDDDDELRGMLAKLLADAGYEVHTASGGRAGAASAIATPPDVVLLDLSMPDIDGWRALEMIREHGPLPAVVVLSSYSRESDKVRALHLGADDYVTKPFSSPELLARVGSAARRSSALRGGIYPATLSFDGIEIDLDRRDATLDGQALSLTKSEYDLLVMLVAEPNRVFSRRQLVERLWGPDWFGDAVMPQSFGGEPFRDPGYRWVGTVLSAFGICYNRDSLARLGLETPPDEWSDLEDPRYRGQIALADPTKSGSTTKAFEMLVQERIQTLARERGLSGDAAVAAGWDDAMRLILRISANSRYFTDSSAKVPRDVAMGDAAVGMCIDFYGRSYNELYRDPATGESRIEFVMPRGGTSIGADPIGLLRGAPSPELAHRFIEFVLSPEGQKIWNYRVGAPGGPTRHALRRPPIRRDFYVEANFPHMTDPTFDPYRAAEGFTYHPEWTGALFAPLRFVIRAACMDPHEEQLAAWEALVAAGLPAEGVAAFEEIGPISYEAVVQQIGPALKNSDKVAQVRLGRELAEEFRKRYLAIAAEYGRR